MSQTLTEYLYKDENLCVGKLLKNLTWDTAQSDRVHGNASALVRGMRAEKLPSGQLEAFLQQYSLSTEEGLALMCLAEALLRIPDKATANALIKDKVEAANWLNEMGRSKDWVVKAAGVGLLVTSRTLDSAMARVGQPFIREAMIRAMGVLGHQFVLGADIEEALQKSEKYNNKGYRLSYDMLGEGARTASDAQRYYQSYADAIDYVGARPPADTDHRPGISVKLSALHPRYEYAQKKRCVPEIVERLLALCHKAASHNIALTVDAEEADRLELSLEIIDEVLKDKFLQGWERFGLAVQAYQKRCLPLIDEITSRAKDHGRRFQMRLVKGAYWDSEIKHAQVIGAPGFPVFTRKSNTDLSYLACAHKMIEAGDYIYPMFGTHNAHSAAAVIEMAREAKAEFEFQRLYGMGEALYNVLMRDSDIRASIYAPVGPHADLLAYLVRRLLENGANTSFVNKAFDPEEPIADLIADPVAKVSARETHTHPNIRMPYELFDKEKPGGRRNSAGVDLADAASVEPLLDKISKFDGHYQVMPIIGGRPLKEGAAEDISNPADTSDAVGQYWPATQGHIEKAFESAGKAFSEWSNTQAETRAAPLEKFADLLEDNTPELMAILSREAGKTIPDALAEIREAVDFARYYANRGRGDFAPQELWGPTGERNILQLHGRGIFVCISPWNFPLAIFTGQVTAALMAGNCVIAKPASQTPLIAMKAVELMHEAGIPPDVLNFLPASGRLGAEMVAHRDTAGVAFTGSTEVAWDINRTLAGKDGPIVPLIAETGGMNAMIVDSSALPEQVIDDVVLSAFGSAGQRCSALRILCIQDDVADKMIRMLQGAMAELNIGNPSLLASDIGPVIDDGAYYELVKHREGLQGFAKLLFEAPLEVGLKNRGHFFAPCAFELPDLKGLEREVFGPILHVVRYKIAELDGLIEELNNKGYGLTLGVHSRIDGFQRRIVQRVRAGNAYINRSMIGAVVGSQPFGGKGLSGTGPKAGGPNYLPRFAAEKVISIDTTAAGGNASLVSLDE